MVRLQRVFCKNNREILFDAIANWEKELADLHKNKTGEPYHYPDTLILQLGDAKHTFDF